MASPTAAAVTANFPHPVLTPFATPVQPPTHASIKLLQRELNANAMSVHSNAGGGLHGHLVLTLTPARYRAVAGVPYPAPQPPPALVVAGAAAAVANAVQDHQELLRLFNRYHDTDKALARLIIAATPDTYIAALCDVDFGYANVTTIQFLTHLTTTYGALTPADRDLNQARMNQPWAPPTPIELLFKQMEDGQRFAAAAAEPIADSTLCRLAYQLVLKTGLFPDGCREWRLLTDAQQTWARFKIHFARQDRDRLETSTANTLGYGTAFHVRPPDAAHLVTSHDATLVPSQVADGSALAATALPSGPELIALLLELRNLRAAAAKAPTAPAPNQKATPGPRGYCWTHGSSSNGAHTSATCKNKAPGHVDTATWRNQQGGNPAIYVPRSRSAANPATPRAPHSAT